MTTVTAPPTRIRVSLLASSARESPTTATDWATNTTVNPATNSAVASTARLRTAMPTRRPTLADSAPVAATPAVNGRLAAVGTPPVAAGADWTVGTVSIEVVATAASAPTSPARYDRYPGTSGITHGEANDTAPAPRASSAASR